MAERQTFVRVAVKDGAAFEREMRALGASGQVAFQRIERSAQPASRQLTAVSRVSGELQGSLQGLAGRAGLAGTALQTFGAGGLAAAAGIGAVAVGVKAALDRTREATRAASELQTFADRIGLGVEALQELRFAGEEWNVTADNVDDGLQELLVRATEAAQGNENYAETFQRLGVELTDANGRLLEGEQIIANFADGIARVSDENVQLQATTELVGDEAAGLVNVFRQGSDGIARMAAEARELGVVLDEDMVRRGRDAEQSLGRLERMIDVNLQAAFVDFAPLLIGTTELVADLALGVRNLIDEFRDLESLSLNSLREELAELEAQEAEILARMAELREGGLQGRVERTQFAQALDDLAEVRQELERIQALIAQREQDRQAPTPGGAPGGGGLLQEVELEAEAATSKLQAFIRALREETEAMQLSAEQREIDTALRQAQNLAMEEGNLLTAEQIEQITAEIEAQQALTAEKERQAEADERLEELRERGQAVREGLRSTLEELNAKERELNELRGVGAITTAEYEQAMTQATFQAIEASGALDLLRGGFDLLDQVLQGNMDTWQDWASVAIDAIQFVIEGLLSSQTGGGGGLFDILSLVLGGGIGAGTGGVPGGFTGGGGGGFFGLGGGGGGGFSFGGLTGSGGGFFNPFVPGLAGGGEASAGTLYRVNELGPRREYFRPDVDGTVIPLGGEASGRGVTYNYFDFRGAERGVAGEARAVFAQLLAEHRDGLLDEAAERTREKRARDPAFFQER